MSHHITINGQTYASVNDMPADVRLQYESAMQMLARGAGAMTQNPSAADVVISTQHLDPGHHIFKTAQIMTTGRVIVDGKEHSNLEELPADVRAKLLNVMAQRSGNNSGNQSISSAQSLAVQLASRTNIRLKPPSFDSSTNITMSLRVLIVILIFAVLGGVFIGWIIRH